VKLAVVGRKAKPNISAGKKNEMPLMEITVKPQSNQNNKQQTHHQSWPSP
jgi:hypothetical protein